jgi:UDP-N-acetylglucosamine 1-carboxyvinyltransferase
MQKIVVEGGLPLSGEVTVSGSKNATLPLMAACILAHGPCKISGAPNLTDIDSLAGLLRELGLRVERQANGDLALEVQDESASTASYDLVRTMRGSVCVLGPMLAKRGFAKVSMPGGCVIGSRPIDLHLRGLEALGATIEVEHGYITARADKLRGARIYMGGAFGSSVLATANVMMAACLAEGRTVIEHAACEPEIKDLARFLIQMGASIEGAGTHRLLIRGVRRLDGTEYKVIPDRIEAGTFIAVACATGSEIMVRGARSEHLDSVLDRFRACGADLDEVADGIQVRPARLRGIELTTLPYPGFPTDMQAQFMAMLSVAEGTSTISEKVYPERFMHASELQRLGAHVSVGGSTAVVEGVKQLSGATVMASDLRASAALVIAGLVADGQTEIRRVYHLDRGYDNLVGKLNALGASIRREEES